MPLLFLFSLLAPSASAVPITDGVVMDVDALLVYIMEPGGGVRAVNAMNGRTQWVSARGDKPVAAADGVVLVHGDRGADGTLPVRLLGGKAGDLLADCGGPRLPAWVGSPLQSGLGTRFASTGNAEGGRFLLTWSASAWYAGGAPPPPEIEAAAAREAAGAWSCSVGAKGAPSKPSGEEVYDVDRLREGEIVHSVRPGAVEGRDGFVYQATDAAGHVTAARWLQATGHWSSVSGDGRHALVVEHDAGLSVVRLYDTTTGALVPAAPGLPYGGHFVLRDGRLVTRGMDGSVVGVEAATGEIAWTQPIRQTAYAGSYPP